MIPQRWIEAYLKFLLKYRGSVTLVVILVTAFFGYGVSKIRLHTDFFDFYPPRHPYIQFYNEFRRMFGSANIMSVIVEVKGKYKDIYNPETLQKLDRVTKWMVNTKGVVPYQILSIAHPKVKSFTASQGGIQIREIYYPGVPKTQEDAERVRFAVYANRGVRGVYVAHDDTAAVVHTGFWEEALDFHYLYDRMMELKRAEDDENHTIYITGFPWLYTSVLQYSSQLLYVFGLTTLTLSFLLFTYFHTWTGVWVPIGSGILSSIWGLGIAAHLGFNLDPLVLVIPIFLTARALSHSVQSMDRYHEEFYRLKDKQKAIIESYSHLFAPAIASIVTDGIGLLIVAVAPIPLIQKVAIFSSFWIISIFISVVTLHPIILSFINPPPQPTEIKERKAPVSLWTARFIMYAVVGTLVGLNIYGKIPAIMGVPSSMITFVIMTPALAWYWIYFGERAYAAWSWYAQAATMGARRWTVLAITAFLFVFFPIWGWTLKVGDMTPGAALLFRDHPYNIAYNKLNEKFLGASQLIVVADTKVPDGIKGAAALNALEEFGDHMELAPGAGRSITLVEIVKTLASLYHDGDPKWGLIPVDPKNIGELFYFFTNSAAAGDLDRFMDPSGRYGSIITLFHQHSHDIIMGAIEHAKAFTNSYGLDVEPDKRIEWRYAGGLFGILAAVNEKVEASYWINLGMIFFIVYFCLYLTYGSWFASALLMIPVILSQLAAEFLMVWMRIDLNVNSLPIAAAGAGVGVDYGIYHFSRMIDCYDEVGNLEEAVDYATATTGKAIIFTGTTMIAGTGFFWLSDLKFLSEMGLLLTLLMTFNKFGALICVPALIKVARPTFLTGRVPKKAMAVEPQAAVAS